MSKPASPWRLDTSAGRSILVYEGCSVIEGEQAEYLMRLIGADALAAQPAAEPGWWRKRADEIEVQVAQGQSDAMRCYTDMRALLQAAAQPARAGGDASGILARALELHDKASMPWAAAEELALSEAGIDEAAVDDLIGEAAPMGLDSLLTEPDSLRKFARAILVHQPLASRAALAAAPQPAAAEAICIHGNGFQCVTCWPHPAAPSGGIGSSKEGSEA